MSDSKKRFAFKPFRTHVPMDNVVANETWESLGNAIDEIYNRNASQLSFEELYRNAYNLVLHKHGNLLYDGVTEKLSSHLLATVNNLANIPNPQLLEEVTKVWLEHQTTMIMIRDILMYMDRTYVPSQRRRPVYELGLHLFRITIWEHPNVQTRVTELILSAITNERQGLLIDDRSLLKSCLGMLLDLGQADYSNVYERDFENLFLGTTQEFYRLESLSYLSSNTAIDYVYKAQSRIEEEHERSQALSFPNTTEQPLYNIVETELIERHAKTLVDMENSGFASLLKDETKLLEMQSMYDLFSRVPSSVDYLRDALSQRIKTDGKSLLSDQEKGISDPSTFVKSVLAMREQYYKVVTISFRNEKRTQKRMKESFEDFLNIDARSASCLAIYVDELLRSGLKGITGDEKKIHEELNKVIIIFRYLSDKDVFEAFYKQHLAKRLLGGRSVSDEAERLMVSQLKAECGYQFTSKLEGMFNDMRISRDMRDTYKQHVKKQQRSNNTTTANDNSDNNNGGSTSNNKPIDIEVDVLTNGYWPSQNVPPCTLPTQIQTAIEKFEKFYLEKHTGRKLSWQTSAGAAEIRVTFGTDPTKLRKHDLCVSTYQMCILMLYGNESTIKNNNTLTLGQIRTQTQIPDMELRRHLISLCTPKHRILRKGSKGRAISSDNDTFTFNHEYTSKLKRVRIPLVKDTMVLRGDIGASSNKDGSGTSSSGAAGTGGGTAGGAMTAGSSTSEIHNISSMVPGPVEEDRRHLVEAAIVRIMKARKALHHNDLIAEVTKQLSIRFVPSPQFIKKRIESLIEREYLERQQDDRRIYMYMA